MDNQNKDRGTIKWTSLMLPEHVQMVKKIWKEEEKVQKPVLDEQELEEINFVLHRALHDNLTLDIQYFDDGFLETVRAKLTYINGYEKKISLIEWKSKDKVKLVFDQIISVEVI